MATHLQNDDDPQKATSRASVCAGESAETAEPWQGKGGVVRLVICRLAENDMIMMHGHNDNNLYTYIFRCIYIYTL